MRLPAVPLRIMALAVIAVSAACGGDSTGLARNDDPRMLATRFDSMWSSLHARGIQPDYYWRRGIDMSYFETPTEFGTPPLKISVRINGKLESWKGFEVQYDSIRDDAGVDTSYWVAAYKGDDLDEFLVAYYSSGELTTVYFGSDTTELRMELGEFQTVRTTKAGSCTAPAVAANPVENAIANSICTPSTFTTSLSTAYAGTGPFPEATFSIENATLPGVLLVRGDTSIH